MLQTVKNIVNEIEKNSKRPIENKRGFEVYILESLTKGRKITFYNWECLPRFLDATLDGKYFVNYDVDLKRIFKGERVDSYTELPRVVAKSESEIKNLKYLNILGIKYRFVKLIADTNAYYLTPETIKILGKGKIKEKFFEFKKLIEQAIVNYPVKVGVYLFTDLMRSYRKKYDNIYNFSKKALQTKPDKLLPRGVLKQQIERTKEHIGIMGREQAVDFSIKTVATYAAEGIVFDDLSKTEYFSNCVWLNNHEVDQRTIDITNCYRKKLGMKNLPMIFLR